MTLSILFVGESWFSHTIEVKGFDQFSVSRYNEATKWIKKALDVDGFQFTHVPSHRIHFDFPDTLKELQKYDVVLISDVGANTFLLHHETFFESKTTVNKLNLIKEYVSEGGSLGMIGGYMTFQGIDGRAKYKDTAIEEILPVTLMSTDDRVEIPEGVEVEINPFSHDILNDLPPKWPPILGYNRLTAKNDAQVLVSNGKDPIIALGEYKKGRTLAYATDCSPHWASPEFCNWEYYSVLWQRIVKWLAQQ
jgi:uncharacterized membrane protein